MKRTNKSFHGHPGKTCTRGCDLINKSQSPLWTVLLVLFFLMFFPVCSEANSDKHVLLLNSYHSGFQWTDEITRGVLETLDGKGTDVHVEYMDTKRHDYNNLKPLLTSLLKIKHQNDSYDVIITSDNNAFEFLKENGELIFGKTPVVFCGVNRLNSEMLKGFQHFTGIGEDTEIKKNLRMLKHFHPLRDKILVITDNTTTGKHIQEQVSSVQKTWKDGEIELIFDVTIDELGKRLESLGNRSVVLHTLFFRDRAGNFFQFSTGTRYITDMANVPVYGVGTFTLGDGVVGGYMDDPYQQGTIAASKALEIIKGKPVSEIPVIWKGEATPHFDYRQLKRWDIPISSLPEGSIILNRPDNFYRQHKKLVINTILIIGVLIIALLGLLLVLKRSRSAEQALSRSEKKYRTLFESSGDAIFILDPESGFLDCNTAALEIFAIPSKKEFRSLAPESLSPEFQPSGERSAKLIDEYLQKVLKGNEDIFEWVHLGADGREFPSTVLLTSIKLAGKTIVQGTIRDITSQKMAEKALMESKNRLDLAMAVSNDGIWDWNLRTASTVFDDRYYTMAGYKPREFENTFTEWMNKVHPDDLGRVKETINNYLAGKIPAFKTEFRFKKKDGTFMWVLGRGKVVERTEDGVPLRFVGTHSDITELKHTEKALRRARKMDAVGQLTGGIAHDFNNILAIVLGNLDLLEQDPNTDPKSLKRISAAHKAATRAADLTRQLLGFSRSQAEHITVTNINHVIRDMKNLIGRSLTPEVTVEYNFGDDLWLTEIDNGDFEDAILNLVINARDAMPGGGRLFIKTQNINEIIQQDRPLPGELKGEYVLLTVRDNGTGISSKHMEKIFEPFFTTKPQGKGTGLGLAMVFGFVKRSGGYIKASSEPEKGTTFYIYLPKSHAKAPLDPPRTKPMDNLPGGNETILVVDDEASLLDLARTTLQSLGYDVLTASNSRQALSLLGMEKPVDLLFSDVVMPGGINGFELAEKAIQKDPNLKILMTSGYTSKTPATSASIEFSRNLLHKPYSQAELARRVRTLLGKSPDSSHWKQAGHEKDIEWKDSFITGISIIDQDHQKLLSLLIRTRKSIESGDASAIKALLNELIESAESHFLREEKLMEECGFPLLRNHRQVHRLLLKELVGKREKLDRSELKDKDLTDFLGSWLVDHIQGMDKHIAPYCKENVEAIEPVPKNTGPGAKED